MKKVGLNHWVTSDGFWWNFELHHFCAYPNEMRVVALTLDLQLETIRMMGSDR